MLVWCELLNACRVFRNREPGRDLVGKPHVLKSCLGDLETNVLWVRVRFCLPKQPSCSLAEPLPSYLTDKPELTLNSASSKGTICLKWPSVVEEGQQPIPSILRIPWTEEPPVGYSPWGYKRHDWACMYPWALMEGFHFRRTFQITLDHPEGKAVTTYSSTRYLWCSCNARAQPSHECTYPDSSAALMLPPRWGRQTPNSYLQMRWALPPENSAGRGSPSLKGFWEVT